MVNSSATLPRWLKKAVPKHRNIQDVRTLLSDLPFESVCESAKCPNIGECWSEKVLTFMLLGNTCTRACTFCAIDTGRGGPPDPDEPRRVAEATERLGLAHVVVTSVARDDLKDQGAGQFVKTIEAIRSRTPGVTIEVLIPDFKGHPDLLQMVVAARPDVLNHNVETVPRLSPKIRPQAKYERSLELLSRVKTMDPSIYTKSGIMIGLGETDDEVKQTLSDLRNIRCDMVTIGQYLAPSTHHERVVEYVAPEKFEEYRRFGDALGFIEIFSGPFVRSSYRASVPKGRLPL